MSGRRSRILLVEDEALNRALVRAILARAAVDAVRDAELIEANSLAQAREQLRNGDADVVLLDMTLPDGSGLTLAREITGSAEITRTADVAGAAEITGTADVSGAADVTGAADASVRRPVVIAVSGGVRPEDRAAASAAGCDDFLDKPYAPADLVAALSAHLSTR